MSAHDPGSKDSDPTAASGAGSHAHEAFDAEPVQHLSEGEPRSPLWLPALGIALFVLFGLYLAIGEDGETAASAPSGSAAAAGASATASPAAEPPQPRGAANPPTERRPTPPDVQRIREQLRQARGGDPTRPPAKPSTPHVHKPGDVH